LVQEHDSTYIIVQSTAWRFVWTPLIIDAFRGRCGLTRRCHRQTHFAARQFVKQAETNPPFVNHLLQKQSGIPYGVAIMAGGLLAIPSLPFVLAR